VTRFRTREDLIPAAAGVVLLLDMLLRWYEIPKRTIGGAVSPAVSANAWQAFGYLDLLIAVTVLVSLAIAVLGAAGRVPAQARMALDGLATITVVMIAYRLLNQPGPNDLVQVSPAAWIGLLLALVVLGGSLRSDAGGTYHRRPHDRP
jgi:cation transport ATPase